MTLLFKDKRNSRRVCCLPLCCPSLVASHGVGVGIIAIAILVFIALIFIF